MNFFLPRLLLILVFNGGVANSAGPLKSEDAYYSASKEIFDAYSKEISDQNHELKIENHWEENTLNGFAEREGSVWKIQTFGGFYRSSIITPDGYMALLCHEMGHHIGGAPFKPDIFWMSVEGQADYFAASLCLKRLWKDQDNVAIVKSQNVPKSLSQICEAHYADEKNLNLCLRIGLAAFSFVEFNRIEHGYPSETTSVQFDNPAKYIIDRYFVYPRAQCRLDTFIAGMTGKDRPRCWYIP